MIDLSALNAVLPRVEKPARYTGGERNAARQKQEAAIRFLFAFPDVYEIGMSHLGTAILYKILNDREDTFAERVFAPFLDMQREMERAGIPLYSLETYTPAAEFDIIGFNLSYELCYTTVLRMLELAGLPLLARERDGLPLVIAGGSCTYNPEPLADFIDLFVIGEGEEVTGELLDLYQEHKKQGFCKETFLTAAAQIKGVYVPSLYRVAYREDGTIEAVEGPQMPVYKRFVSNFDASVFPTSPVVPYVNIVHDRSALEIFRGCTRGCRFCQAGFIYRPVRERSVETLLCEARALCESTGYEEISLTSLSSGDYSEIDKLVGRMMDEQPGVAVSLPSLRVDSFEKEYASRMQLFKKSSLTFAPEAGTQRLRDVINKNVTEEDILRSLRYAFESGATTIKLYFMIGLPTETFEDLDGIVEMVKKIIGVFRAVPRELRRGGLRLNVSTSCFVPKAHTPFQWEPQDNMELLREKQRYLKERLQIRGVSYGWHDPKMSYLEAVFARGDRRLGKALLHARKGGAMFDSWREYFRFDAFEEGFKKAGVDPDFYATRRRDEAEVLPWSHISAYLSEDYLRAELAAARAAKTTPDCREGCNACGLEGRCCK